MAHLQVHLLGKFSASLGEAELFGLRTGKVKELLCYLLLHRDREHCREVLAAQLWGECTTPLSKKYLRQALWQIHQELRHPDFECGSAEMLHADAESVKLDPSAGINLDVDEVEKAFRKASGIPANRLDEATAEALHHAIALYRGELLPGCYLDWCLYHRERLQNMYLTMLDTLMAYSEVHGQFATGKELGERSLKEDPARERTYACLMRIDYFSGDRAGALRRFQKCEAALRRELNVGPAQSTLALCEQIRADRLPIPCGAGESVRHTMKPAINVSKISEDERPEDASVPLQQRLEHLRTLLVRLRRRVKIDIKAVDEALSGRNHSR